MFESPAQTLEALAQVGYLTDPITATTVYLADRLHKPLLLEGPAGSGKTELSYAVMRAVKTPIERLQCFEGITAEHAIGKFDESLQRLYLELASRAEHPDWQALAREISAQSFFVPGPLLKALLSKEPCVLLIDELDKVDHAFEATLLEILSVWQLSVPRLGTVAAESIPFTVLTSNEERRLGDPLRRRGLYLRIEYPTPEREGEIVARRTPEASPETHRLIAGFAKALPGTCRGYGALGRLLILASRAGQDDDGSESNVAQLAATATGGKYLPFNAGAGRKDLEAKLYSIANDLPNRYMLSFRPTSPTSGLHNLQVAVRGHPGVEVASRTSYWVKDNPPKQSRP